MKKLLSLGSVALACALVAGCGGGDSSYSTLVVFGDSLSDVGTYRTPGIATFGGGQYTVNGATSANWTTLLARELDLAAPCPAQTGLESSGPLVALAAPIENHKACFSYAQGGARVTEPIGPWNKAVLALPTVPSDLHPTGLLGQLTVPLVDQVARHLKVSGSKFFGSELVTVMAGANDLFMQLYMLQATAENQGDTAAAATAAVGAMAQAGAQLASYIKNQMVDKGARHVVVVNLPDVGKTPSALAASTQTQALITLMAQTFNDQLTRPLVGAPGVLLVDAFSASQDQAAHPELYGLTNVTTPACDLNKTAFPSSLVCSTPATVVAGDISHYQFSDTVHPTPYGYRLLAELVAAEMTKRGWLESEGQRPCQHSAAGCTLNRHVS